MKLKVFYTVAQLIFSAEGKSKISKFQELRISVALFATKIINEYQTRAILRILTCYSCSLYNFAILFLLIKPADTLFIIHEATTDRLKCLFRPMNEIKRKWTYEFSTETETRKKDGSPFRLKMKIGNENQVCILQYVTLFTRWHRWKHVMLNLPTKRFIVH